MEVSDRGLGMNLLIVSRQRFESVFSTVIMALCSHSKMLLSACDNNGYIQVRRTVVLGLWSCYCWMYLSSPPYLWYHTSYTRPLYICYLSKSQLSYMYQCTDQDYHFQLCVKKHFVGMRHILKALFLFVNICTIFMCNFWRFALKRVKQERRILENIRDCSSIGSFQNPQWVILQHHEHCLAFYTYIVWCQNHWFESSLI